MTHPERKPGGGIPGSDWREAMLRAFVMLGAAALLLTEILSPFHLVRPVPLLVGWIATGAFILWRLPGIQLPARMPALTAAGVACIAIIGGTVACIALVSPPNSADAMAYHMPRVVYWAQAGSASFFPTSYLNQIMLPPLAEYCMLHTYVLTGGDHLVNLVALFGFLGSIAGVSAIAAAMGVGPRGQLFSALCCATLPNAILQASGSKNDSLLALWLVCMVYFGARRNAMFTGMAAGLALATKGTAYLFLPPLLLLFWRDWRKLVPWLAGGILVFNAPQYARNLLLSGSPLGYDSAQADGFYRWRNEHPGWRSLISNALRNTSEQLGARSAGWNETVYRAAIGAHHALGLDPQDSSTTWPYARFEPPNNANHEANANNRWHLGLFAAALVFAAIVSHRSWMLYGGALVAAFLLFCFYLKWQPFLARLELPLFVLSAPLAGFLLERIRPRLVAIAIVLFLLAGTRLPLLENWTRPLRGPRSILTATREDMYFYDMSQWNNQAWYRAAADTVAAADCERAAIDINENQLEYPFQVLLRARRPAAQFFHRGVRNVSMHYYDARTPPTCATVVIGSRVILTPQ